MEPGPTFTGLAHVCQNVRPNFRRHCETREFGIDIDAFDLSRGRAVQQLGRILPVVIAVLALGGIYALLRQDASHGGASPPAMAEATRASESVVPRTGPATAVPSLKSSPVVEAPSAAAQELSPPGVFRLVIADLKPGVDMPALKARQGDPISIVIASSQYGTLEVHGYGQRIALKPGTDATLAFKAEHTGRFPIHLHGRNGEHLEVTALEILPQ